MATSTTKGQRIAIWIIAAMMVFGSVGFYFLIILQNRQQAEQQAKLQEQLQQQQQLVKPLPGYEAEKFDADSVSRLTKKDLKQGKGKTVSETSTIKVNYMGWLPSGELFDSNSRGGTPEPVELTLGSVIEGWQKGVPGMKEGGVRKLVIPAEQAYGKEGATGIPADTPLAFIVEVVKVK